MAKRTEALEVYFYKTSSGNEPVREWLKELPKEDKRTIGFDSNVSNGIARVIFYVEDNTMVLLHAFIKKSQKTPQKDLDVAIKRYKELLRKS